MKWVLGWKNSLLLSMSHYTGLDKLHQVIWCEILVVREGYIPYLKKWSKHQQSAKKAEVDENPHELHSDIQRLVPGGPKMSDSQKLTNSTATRCPSEKPN